MKCPNCGKEIANDSQFCEFCGCKISSSRKSRRIIGIICLILLCVSAIGICIYKRYETNQIALAEAKQQAEDAKLESERLKKKNFLLTQGYVDLGLPSGTLWKKGDEEGFYTYNQAKEKYGDSLPSKAQFEELIAQCKFEWNNNNKKFEVLGKNGCSVSFGLPGFMGCVEDSRARFAVEEVMYGIGNVGSYWSSTQGSSQDYGDYAWRMDFYDGENDYYEKKVALVEYFQCFGFCVRLVANP